MPHESILHDKTTRHLVGAALVLLCVFLITASIKTFTESKFVGTGINPANTITVDADAEVTAVPDVAMFTVSVVEERETTDAAQEASAESINAIIAFLEDEGVAERDVKTTNYNVNPRYDWVERICAPGERCGGNERVLRGYEVSQGLRVKVRDTDAAGALLAGVGELGATNVSGLQFEIDDADALERQARQEAIAAAKAKARALASDLGVEIVRVVSFSEGGSGYQPPVAFMARAESMAFDAAIEPEIPVGENTIRSNVSITYEIR